MLLKNFDAFPKLTEKTDNAMNETEDQFVQATKAAFAILGFAGSFDERRCREIYRRTRRTTDRDTSTLAPASVAGEQLTLL
jgi:hypothetical protein